MPSDMGLFDFVVSLSVAIFPVEPCLPTDSPFRRPSHEEI